MVRLGTYRQVYESHRDSFRKSGYSENESSALAQVIVAESLPEFALIRPATSFAPAIPHAKTLLEWDQCEGASFRTINLKATWRAVRVRIISMKLPSAARAA